MNEDLLWEMIDGRRRRTADLLEGLTDEEWNRPTLCDGWTVRHVAAHLTLQQQGVGDALATLLRHPAVMRRPTLNGLIHNSAIMQSRLPRQEITARIRAMIGSRRHNVGVTPRDTHTDIVLHGQDIALPLGKELPLDPAEAAVAADRLWQTRPTRLSVVYRKLPLDGHRLVADDVDWQVGDGSEVRGPIMALLLTLGGRTALVHELHGSGADALRASTSPP
ncbi:MAG: maleylpyruvate isomerase family mycothiol-dependent enzyme [Candidatus Phosphoribacter sp.]|nr:maleylpyruvate isomerase family mycothiol-dependent enzyme [Actinomycetales bacterium]